MDRKRRYILGFALLALGAGLLAWVLLRDDGGASAGFLDSREQQVPSRMDGEGADSSPETDSGAEAEAEADVAHAIRGQVVRPRGEPAPGARVVIQATGDTEPIEIVADAGGMFRVDDLPVRMYAIEASAESHGPAIVIGVVPGGAPLRLTLSGGRSVSGQVTANGEPVAGATVHLGGPGVFPQRAFTTGADGRFTAAGLRPGRYEYIALKSGLSSGFGGVVTVDDDGTMTPETLNIELTSAPITGLVFRDRATNEPVDVAVATFASRSMYVLALHAIADSGTALVDYLRPDEYVLRVRAPGYLPYDGRFWITPAGGEQEIHLSRGGRVCGRILDEAGNGVGGARIEAAVETTDSGRYELRSGVFEQFHRLARPDGSPFFWPTSSYDSSTDGSYCIGGLPEGELRIVASAEGYAHGASRALKIQQDQAYESINLTLSRGRSFRGRVETNDGAPVASAHVVATDANLPGWINGESSTTNRSGVFRIDNLPGRVRVRVRHPSYGVHEEFVEIPSGGLDDYIIRLDVPDAMTVTGRVLETQSGPAAGAFVWLMRGGSSVPVCRTATDDDGMFRASDCSAPPDRILVRHEGFAPLNKAMTDPNVARDWVLRRGGEIALVTGRNMARIEVEPTFNLPTGIWPRPAVELEPWSREILQQVAPGRYKVSCETAGYAPTEVIVAVDADRRVEAVCPLPERLQELSVVVIDPQGAPVENALVSLRGIDPPVSELSDERGRVSLELHPGQWVRARAVHERWGEGETVFRSPSEASEPFRIELTEPVGTTGDDDATELLADWGISAVRDNRSVIIDTVSADSPGEGVGIRRRDLLLWARKLSENRISVGVRRGREIVTFELNREQ